MLYVSLPAGSPALTLGEITNRVRAIPTVKAVAAGSPFSSDELVADTEEVRVPGQPPGTGKPAALSSVSSEYFETLGIPLLRGRTLVGPGEAVVSQAFEQHFPEPVVPHTCDWQAALAEQGCPAARPAEDPPVVT